MREITMTEVEFVCGGGQEAYDAGYATGEFVGKVLIGTAVLLGIYVALAYA